MTEETLRQAIVEAIGEEVARRVSAKLIALQKKALVVCTASTMGFSQWLVGLQQLEQEGFTLTCTCPTMLPRSCRYLPFALPYRSARFGLGRQSCLPRQLPRPITPFWFRP